MSLASVTFSRIQESRRLCEKLDWFPPGPLLQSHGLMKAIQEVLQMASGFSVEQSQAYPLHSPHHFLPEVSAARGDPGTYWCTMGRWSHSVAQIPALRPETNMLRKHRARASTLPDLYAKTLQSVLWLFPEDTVSK